MSDGQAFPESCFASVLAVTADCVFIIKDQCIQYVSVGDEVWLQPDSIRGVSIENLLSETILTTLREQVSSAQASGDVSKARYIFRPEHLPELKNLGLSETIWFETRLNCVDASTYVWSLRNINERKKLERKISHQAQRDSLTGAYNRRALIPVMEQNIAQAQRYDGICSMLLIDIDDFSRVNDDFGWDAGDQLLRQIVTSLYQMKRTADFLVRFGDDQIGLFLPETNHEQAVLAGERARRLVSELDIPSASGNVSCTVSVGVSSLSGPEDTAAEMMKRIIENLAIARHCGGNRVEGDS
ncbi:MULTISPECIES: GGDEF domain-containing protein [Nitrincola]|uniref:diguanylate cyclase n=1 Tax=Nitrincola nitratireducens TaxID=1229521 RepID=W9UWA8_9GAMM|nr:MULTISPECIES: GGDEF domain-containing protein [Nitrincola]EXJ11533.1 Diguanylate cyclase DosC [Nitrincola nitratireducens]